MEEKSDNTSVGIICLYYNSGCYSLRVDLNMSFVQPHEMITPSSQYSITNGEHDMSKSFEGLGMQPVLVCARWSVRPWVLKDHLNLGRS